MSQTVFAYQAVPAAANGAAASQSAPGPAAPVDAGPFGGWGMLLMFVPMLILIFWQSRSQQKKQEQAIAELKKGDRCVTQSGIVGRLLELDNRYAKLEIAPNVKITVLRTSISGRDTEDSAKSSDAKSSDAKASETKDEQK